MNKINKRISDAIREREPLEKIYVYLFEDLFCSEEREREFIECVERITEAGLIDGVHIVENEDIPDNLQFDKYGIDKAWNILRDYFPHNTLVDAKRRIDKYDEEDDRELSKKVNAAADKIHSFTMFELLLGLMTAKGIRSIYFAEIKERIRGRDQ